MSLIRHNWKFCIWCVVFLGMITMAPLIKVSVERVVEARVRNSLLHSWGLDPTKENIRLFEASFNPPPTSKEPPFWESQASLEEDADFSENGSYLELLADETITMGVYCQDTAVTQTLHQLCVDITSYDMSITMVYLDVKEEVLDAFNNLDLVFFLGHANLGKGMFFEEGRGGADYLSLGLETLVIPTVYVDGEDLLIENLGDGTSRIQGEGMELTPERVNTKLFAFMGCRTDFYYRHALKCYFPKMDFIGANYNWDATSFSPAMMKIFVSGLEHRRTLEEIVGELNKNREITLLNGRRTEVGTYKNSTRHPDNLLTYD